MDKQKPALNLLCVICDRDKQEKIATVVDGQRALFNLATLGKGTASSRILNYLGIGETDKTVFLSILPATLAKERMHKLTEDFHLKEAGQGIAFCVGITHGCYHKTIAVPAEETGGETMDNKAGTDLVLVVVNPGYTEEVMEVAREQGATGGTVLHARGCGLTGAEKFFGVTIQPEKELIMIVASDAISCAIMESIAQKTGPETDAGAVSFSLPVAAAVGIGLDVPREEH
ncbi:P-II family nitrogen regulator [Ruminococcaceae bacterium OttesenSCG-928-A16]|nr:P-II family nitrogen regulator [Ruminococcaceae bacterium OttesenSCG-928-A16]